MIDHKILRVILGAQEKVPVEMLYLETAELPIKHVISVRRLLYLHTIIKRHKTEITRKVYTAMKDEPYKGDWINLVKKDLETIDINLENEEEISNMTTEAFKVLVKRRFRDEAFKELQIIKSEHKKVKYIKHTSLSNPQSYLISDELDNKAKSVKVKVIEASKTISTTCLTVMIAQCVEKIRTVKSMPCHVRL